MYGTGWILVYRKDGNDRSFGSTISNDTAIDFSQIGGGLMLRKIRVLVVEDSLVFRELLVQNLNKDEGI